MPPKTRITEMEFYSSELETVIMVTYENGTEELFVVPTTNIYVNETINGRRFGRLLDDNTDNRLDAQ